LVKFGDLAIDERNGVRGVELAVLRKNFGSVPILMRDYNNAQADEKAEEEGDAADVRPDIHRLIVAREKTLTETADRVVINAIAPH